MVDGRTEDGVVKPMRGVSEQSAATTPEALQPVPEAPLDALALRQQFPVLSRQVHGKPLVYLDNAATVQRPLAVI